MRPRAKRRAAGAETPPKSQSWPLYKQQAHACTLPTASDAMARTTPFALTHCLCLKLSRHPSTRKTRYVHQRQHCLGVQLVCNCVLCTDCTACAAVKPKQEQCWHTTRGMFHTRPTLPSHTTSALNFRATPGLRTYTAVALATCQIRDAFVSVPFHHSARAIMHTNCVSGPTPRLPHVN